MVSGGGPGTATGPGGKPKYSDVAREEGWVDRELIEAIERDIVEQVWVVVNTLVVMVVVVTLFSHDPLWTCPVIPLPQGVSVGWDQIADLKEAKSLLQVRRITIMESHVTPFKHLY